MHGQYKVPGGKLVIVDFDVREGRIANPSVTGDFFLEPDEAIIRINQGLRGLEVTSRVGEITKAIESMLVPSDSLVGFRPRDIGMAVRRAIGASTTWSDYSFELIEDEARDPYMQMALDEVYARALSAGTRGPTLRIWEWDRPAVVLGSFQSVRNEVNMQAARDNGITVVRRISGGGAMFIEPGNTITYSIVVPGSLVDGLTFEESYEFLDSWVIQALQDMGINASHQSLNDISSPAGKIAGAAQKRLADGTVLHHVTMAYDIDADKMTRVLRIGQEKIADKGIRSANKRVDPLKSQTNMGRELVVAFLIDSFSRQHILRASRVYPDEEQSARQLVRSKFATEEWIQRIP